MAQTGDAIITGAADALQLYFGDDYVINQHITLRQPTIGDIIKMGEERYYATVHALTAIPSDMKSVLWDAGVDWTELLDLEFFALMTAQIPQSDASIFFGDLDLSAFRAYKREDGEVFLANDDDVVIDTLVHLKIADFLCRVHNIKKKPERPGNRHTKTILIDEDRHNRQRRGERAFESQLLPLISSMVNSAGFKYNLDDIRGLKLYAFMDSVARIQTIKAIEHMTTAYYSGNIDVKKFDTRKLDWLAPL
jgi:hypothetical protein